MLRCSTPLPLQVCERVLLELNPATAYTFPSHHTAIKEPYDYFAFGQRYIRCGGGGGGEGGRGHLGQPQRRLGSSIGSSWNALI